MGHSNKQQGKADEEERKRADAAYVQLQREPTGPRPPKVQPDLPGLRSQGDVAIVDAPRAVDRPAWGGRSVEPTRFDLMDLAGKRRSLEPPVPDVTKNVPLPQAPIQTSPHPALAPSAAVPAKAVVHRPLSREWEKSIGPFRLDSKDVASDNWGIPFSAEGALEEAAEDEADKVAHAPRDGRRHRKFRASSNNRDWDGAEDL